MRRTPTPVATRAAGMVAVMFASVALSGAPRRQQDRRHGPILRASGGQPRRAACESQTREDVDTLIDLWQDVGEDAPLSIEPDWQAHILLFETALEGEDEEEIFARIYATERSSVAVSTWIAEHAASTGDPSTTIVPQTTTTIAAGSPRRVSLLTLWPG